MATTPTSNQVPSESPIDLKFNAGKIDEFVTSLAQQYIDRFGNAHYTIEGLKQLVLNLGWNPVGSFQDGATVNTAGDIIQDESTGVWYRWDDIATLPKTVPSGSTPGSTGGTGEGKWQAVDVSDVLRKQISDPDGATKYPELQIARWRDEGDLRGWGCVCDGVADDSDSLQEAIVYSENHDKSLFSPGKLRITKKIIFTKPPQIRGYKYSPPVVGAFAGVPYEHSGAIIYSEVPSGYCIVVNPPENNVYIRGLVAIDLHVIARGDGVNGKGVLIANCGWGGYIRGLVAENFLEGGITLSQVQDAKIDQLEVLNCGTDGQYYGLTITNYSNLLAFYRCRLETNNAQMLINGGFGFEFNNVHFEQGDYPGSSAGDVFQKINRYPSIKLVGVDNVKFIGGQLFGATLQRQMEVHSITADQAPYYIAVDGACSAILFNGCTMGFGYGSGKIIEMHGSGKITKCDFKALCTEVAPIVLDQNIQFKGNDVSYQDNETSNKFIAISAAQATLEGNIFGCVNPSSVTKTSGAIIISDPARKPRLGMNQFIIDKYNYFTDGNLVSIDQSSDGFIQVPGGAMDMRQFNPNKKYSIASVTTVSAVDYLLDNQVATFLNTSTGNVTFNHSPSLSCKGAVSAVVPPGEFISFIKNGFTGTTKEISRSF
ncbi:hypothetical protein U0Y97_02820 [Enterobacter chuandaensis]|uniref:tail fiber/spike domain-containing protein n=1 Tax=Enterobacter chuandaensis TaxID=2497875 RepID=UPI0039C33B7A